MATDKQVPTSKKRRIRPAPQTVREQATAASKKAQKPPKVGFIRRTLLRPIGKFLKMILFPLYWLGKHIVPRYLKNSFNELREVTWPNRQETRKLTTAVIIFAVIFGFVISMVDYGLDKVFKKVFLNE